jgi:sucrose-phosphate synthase
MTDSPLYILMLSVHGLIKADDLELGRDADTGGQVQYVVEAARALGEHPDVERVDLITRAVDDPDVDPIYAHPEQPLGARSRIVRLPFGPRRYLRKEVLWPHLDLLVDRCLLYLHQQGRLPDVIHSHYADAGYVGRQLSFLLGIPLVHTAHSLGLQKQARLLAAGRKEHAIERQFNFLRRVQSEEQTLEHASLIVTSTRQEAATQYAGYARFDPRRAVVIPPGIDLTRFSPGSATSDLSETTSLVEPFLRSPRKPAVLALCRPDKQKNIGRLLYAFATTPGLSEAANLVIVAGNRDHIREVDEAARAFYTDLLLDIDRYDLYGKVAMPKHHRADQVADIYRYAARTRGVLVNPSLVENFGLTLIEAAASGLPVVATANGGPQEVLANCRHGLLVDPLDADAIGAAVLSALSDRERWRRWARNGVNGTPRHYTWRAHADKYVASIRRLQRRDRKRTRRTQVAQRQDFGSPMTLARNLLVTDLDNTLIGDDESMRDLFGWLEAHAGRVAFGVATGRTRASALKLLAAHRVPAPDVLITSVGTDICYGPGRRDDDSWKNHISHLWRRDDLLSFFASVPGVRPQPMAHQTEFKLAYHVDSAAMPSIAEIYNELNKSGLRAQLIPSHDAFLDVLPIRASKGRAIRYLAYRWGFSLTDFLVAGDSGNDADMLSGDTLGVVVGGHAVELKRLRNSHRVYFADAKFAGGVNEGIAHYGFGGAPTAESVS